MTVGEDLLNHLRPFGKRYTLFEYSQYKTLKEIDSINGLKSFLSDNGFDEVLEEGNVSGIAQAVSLADDAKRAEDYRGYLFFSVLQATPLGYLLLPILLPLVCIALAVDKHGRLRFSLAETIGFTTIVAVILAFEMSVATKFDIFSCYYRLTAITIISGLCGLVAYRFFRRAVWFALSFTIAFECEVVAFVFYMFRDT